MVKKVEVNGGLLWLCDRATGQLSTFQDSTERTKADFHFAGENDGRPAVAQQPIKGETTTLLLSLRLYLNKRTILMALYGSVILQKNIS